MNPTSKIYFTLRITLTMKQQLERMVWVQVEQRRTTIPLAWLLLLHPNILDLLCGMLSKPYKIMNPSKWTKSLNLLTSLFSGTRKKCCRKDCFRSTYLGRKLKQTSDPYGWSVSPVSNSDARYHTVIPVQRAPRSETGDIRVFCFMWLALKKESSPYHLQQIS